MNQFERLKNVIESDHMKVSKNYDTLIRFDVETLLRDYFDLRGGADIRINTDDSGYNIEINCRAVRIKPIGVLPG
jgi:hypothetical protein